MTVDIARMDANALAVTGGANDALARLGAWVEAARNAHQLVAPLVGTAFIPDAYKPKVDPRATPEQRAEAHATAIANATAAVLQGITLGLDPMTALQQIYVVHGRPGLYARVMVALVQAHGHEVWTEDISDSRAVVCGRRRGTEVAERVTVTMEQARKAGWTSNQAYTKTPQDMLWARAAARVCNRIAADVLMGITSVEEIQDDIRVEAEVGTRTVTPRRRTPAAAVEAGPVEDPPLEHTEPAAPAEQAPSISPERRAELTRLLKVAGRNGRSAAASYISGVVGRAIAAATDLTEDEAGGVIAALEVEVETKTAAEPDDEEPTLDLDEQS